LFLFVLLDKRRYVLDLPKKIENYNFIWTRDWRLCVVFQSNEKLGKTDKK